MKYQYFWHFVHTRLELFLFRYLCILPHRKTIETSIFVVKRKMAYSDGCIAQAAPKFKAQWAETQLLSRLKPCPLAKLLLYGDSLAMPMQMSKG
jgi:hypothetical protein